MSDIFDETEENLRADRVVAIVKVALPWVSAILVLALVIALGVWGWQSWRATQSAHAAETYQAGLDASGKGDKATAKTKFEAAAKAGNPAYKALALMELGAMALDDNNTDEALKDFDAAAKATSSPLLSDTAALKAAYLAMDKSSLADEQKRLAPLMADKRPLAAMAKEAMALAKLQSGDVNGARADLKVLGVTLGAPDGVKQRATEIVAAIDSGAAPTALAILKQPEPAAAIPNAALQSAVANAAAH
ncbi:MAG TPA: tetratricopeptide repeat protein [Asticcacaulis sp.]